MNSTFFHARKQHFVHVAVYVVISVLLKRFVYSVKKVCLKGMSVLSKRCVCSVKEVCLFFQKGLSVLSKQFVRSIKEVCLFFQKYLSVLGRNIAEQSSEDRPLVICLLNAASGSILHSAGIIFYAASSDLQIDCDCQSTEKRSIL